MNKSILSRRDVLKLGSFGLMGLILPDVLTSPSQTDPFASLQVRIIDRVVWAFDKYQTYGYQGTKVEIRV